MLLPLLSAISESFATILDKFNLNIKKLDGKVFTAFLFIFMALWSIPFLYFFEVSDDAFTFFPILVLVLIIIASALHNALFYIGLRNKDLSNIEPIRNSEPMVTIILAFFLFPAERSVLILGLGFITTLALIYSHLAKQKKNKIVFDFDKYAGIVLIAMVLAALVNIGIQYSLDYFSPVTLYAIRAISVAIILVALYKPQKTKLENKQWFIFFFAGLLYSAAAIFKNIAIVHFGVSVTVLILTLSPTIIYIFSWLLLKERFPINKIIASCIIIFCVTIAAIYV